MTDITKIETTTMSFPRIYTGDDMGICIRELKKLSTKENKEYEIIYTHQNSTISDLSANDSRSMYKATYCLNTDAIKRLVYGIEMRYGLSVTHGIDKDIMWIKPKHICIPVTDRYDLKYVQKSESTQYIYILELSDGKYYVGKTQTPDVRIDDHAKGSGSRWTGLYAPVKIIDIIEMENDFDEDKYTLQLMREKGIENVRGGTFCEVVLGKENLTTINKMIQGSENRCYVCGKTGHYAKTCYSKNSKKTIKDDDSNDHNMVIKCDRCGKSFDTTNGLRYHQKIYCKNITTSVPNKKSKIRCFRCGRENHVATDCYASTHVNGKVLINIEK